MRNIKEFANSSPFLGEKYNAYTLHQGSQRNDLCTQKLKSYKLGRQQVMNPINLCSGSQTMFSFHPSPLLTKLRHQVWNLRITAMIFAKVTKLQLMAFGSRTFQQTSVCWTVTNPPLQTPLPIKRSGKSHYFIILKKYLSKRQKKRNDLIHLTEKGTSTEIIYNSKWDCDI